MAHTLRLMLSHCKNFKMCVARRAVCIDVYRCISTSKKNKDTTIPVQPVEIEQKSKELQELEEHFADQDIYSDKVILLFVMQDFKLFYIMISELL